MNDNLNKFHSRKINEVKKKEEEEEEKINSMRDYTRNIFFFFFLFVKRAVNPRFRKND